MVVEEEAVIIKELCERVLAGEQLNEIARDLNNRGIPTIRGAEWRATTIVGIVRSARIAGHREHRGVITKRNVWEAIIDDETSLLLRHRLAAGRSQGTRGGPRKHLLTGLLRCGYCGHGMVRGLAGRTKTPNYRCPKNQGSGACGRMSISFEGAESYLAEAVFEAHDRAQEGESNESDLATWLEKRQTLENRKAKIAELMATGVMDTEEWVSASAAIKRQLAALPEPKTNVSRSVVTGQELRAGWAGMTTAAKRATMEDMFNFVTVMPRRIVKGAKVFDPGRLIPDWKR
ncbi:recombinase family protein [Crystallibacter crystallopoietes]|nr:recombinase family protein [Arthrobacter crystallopoietes]